MAPTAPAAILCGDPARALTIAQELLVEPRMSNHHRGLWGYHGTMPDGLPLTVHATGIGGPAAAIVLAELARRGLRTAVRVGTAVSLDRAGPPVGSRLAADRVIPADGTSVAYGADPGVALTPDPELSRSLAVGADAVLAIRSLDRRADPIRDQDDAVGAVFDLQSAGLLAAANSLGVRLAVGVVVSRDPRGPLEDDPLEAAALDVARLAATALAGHGAGMDVNPSRPSS